MKKFYSCHCCSDPHGGALLLILGSKRKSVKKCTLQIVFFQPQKSWVKDPVSHCLTI